MRNIFLQNYYNFQYVCTIAMDGSSPNGTTALSEKVVDVIFQIFSNQSTGKVIDWQPLKIEGLIDFVSLNKL